MKTDDLIKNLSTNLQPVKRQASPNIFAVKYLFILFFIIALGLLLLRLRSDLHSEWHNPAFVLNIGLNLFILHIGIFLVGWLSTAGRLAHEKYKFIIFILFFIVLIFNSYRLSFTTVYFKNFTMNIFDMKCFAIVMSLSLLSTALVTIAVAKRIVLEPGIVGAIIGLLSFSLGSFVISMHCPITIEEHVTLYHIMLPMFFGSLAGYISGKSFLKI